jgi:large subunit ribosomal protein L4
MRPEIYFLAVPISEPVYLAMATPLIPKKEFHSPQESVAVLDPTVFNHPIRRDILHLCVVHHLDSLRQGTASTKTRGEVRGSGRKIRPQKGLGAARLGGRQSPMLRGGGVAFGPKPRDFSTKLPRKVIQMGMRVALSAKVKENKLGLVEKHDWPNGKTNSLAHRIDYLGWRKSLLVTGEENFSTPLQRAGRNLAMVGMSTAAELTVYDIVKWPRLILDVAAVDYFERKLSRTTVVPEPSL